MEQKLPYEESFLTYLKGLMKKEQIEIQRIDYGYKFRMTVDVIYPIGVDKDELKDAIQNQSNAISLIRKINNRVMDDVKDLYFSDLCEQLERAYFYIPHSSLQEYGFSSLDAFEEYEENRKRYPNRECLNYIYKITNQLALLVNKNSKEHQKSYCRIKFRNIEPMELFHRLYEKETN